MNCFCCWESWNLEILPARLSLARAQRSARGPSLSPEELQGSGRGFCQGVVRSCGSPVGRALGVSENAAEQKVKEEKDRGSKSLVNQV